MTKLEYELRKVKKIEVTCSDTKIIVPNIVGIVNLPGFPVRGYIFDTELAKIYGSVEKAAEHFVIRTKKIPNKEEFKFTLGFVKGKDWSKEPKHREGLDRDIIYMHFEPSDGKFNTKPYMAKCRMPNHIVNPNGNDEFLGKGSIDATPPNISIDMSRILGYEMDMLSEMYPNNFEYFINNFPRLPEKWGLEYLINS